MTAHRYPLALAMAAHAIHLAARVLCLWDCDRELTHPFTCRRGCGRDYNRVRDCGRTTGGVR
jgi:hypothetical protein